MSYMLFACAIDLGGSTFFAERAASIASTLDAGIGGAVRYSRVDGGVIAVRELAADPDNSQRLDTGWTPQWSQDGTLTVLVGQLLERQEAADRLRLPFDVEDAAIYANAWVRYGEQCDSQLLGDYAVLQYQPEQRRIRLARSALGKQPIHVWRSGDRVVAGSIPRSLMAAGLVPTVDTQKLEDSLLLNSVDARRSWYAGAHRVPGGAQEIHTPGRTRASSHWNIDDISEVRFKRDEEYVEALDARFRRAMGANLEGIERPAILLSGGLDSQCVASYLAELRLNPKGIESYTAVPQGGYKEPRKPYSFGDEAPYVRELAERYEQLNPHFVTGEHVSYGQESDRIFALGGWPIRNESNMHWVHAAYSQAAASGCDAMFSGGNGNATFSYDGETGYPTWLKQGRFLQLFRELKSRSHDERALWRKFVSLAVMPHLPTNWRKTIQQRRGVLAGAFSTWCPMREDYAKAEGVLERARAQKYDPEFLAFGSSRDWRRWALGEMQSEAAEIDLSLRLLHGLPSRDPTMFRPFVEFTVGVPDEQFMRKGVDRSLARRLLQNRIPERTWKERRVGRQSPDWAIRFAKERDEHLAELRSLMDDPVLAPILDVERLISDLENWDGTEDSAGISKLKIHAGIGRALSTARFVRYVERRNVGA